MASAGARAQSAAWPTRGPIKLVAPHLSRALGQRVVAENRPGAGGIIGTDYVSKQASDGYTLLVSHSAVHVYTAATRRTLPFDPLGDFTHMGMLVEAPMILAVCAASPFRTLDQVVTAACSKPVRHGTSGIGSAKHLFGELLKIVGKAPQHDPMPYQGSATATQDLLGGQIDSVFDPITTNVAALKGGTLRALAVSTPKRLPALPNIPTFAELGCAKLTGSQWLGLSAPKGLPAPVAQKLASLIPAALTNTALYDHCPELVAACVARGDELVGHGHSNAERQGVLGEEAERVLLLQCRERMQAESRQAPAGWLSPSISESRHTRDLLAEAGCTYTLNWCHDDQPLPMHMRSGQPLWAVP